MNYKQSIYPGLYSIKKNKTNKITVTFLGSGLFGLAVGQFSVLGEKILHQSHWNDLFYN